MIARDLYRCVDCDSSLVADAGSLRCAGCGESYPVVGGTARLMTRLLREQLVREETETAKRTRTRVDDPATEVKLRTAASFGFEWQRFHHLRPEWEHNFLEYMQPRGPDFFQGKRILDAGCGTGRHAYYAAKFGAEVAAVDLSDAIDVARENTRELGRVDTVQADLYHLPFAPESFDFIYSFGVLHHLPDPQGAFRNLLRYLRPGGEIQIYLYWWPESAPVKRALLRMVNGLRALTLRVPHGALYWLSYPLAAFAYAGFVLPYRMLRAVPRTAVLAERFPMKQYANYPFRVCVNDQFDRFSAPIENRYTRAEVEAWFQDAGLEEITVRPNWGWLGCGRKPVNAAHRADTPSALQEAAR